MQRNESKREGKAASAAAAAALLTHFHTMPDAWTDWLADYAHTHTHTHAHSVHNACELLILSSPLSLRVLFSVSLTLTSATATEKEKGPNSVAAASLAANAAVCYYYVRPNALESLLFHQGQRALFWRKKVTRFLVGWKNEASERARHAPDRTFCTLWSLWEIGEYFNIVIVV